MQEKDIGELRNKEQPITYKWLSLITPELASEGYGIPAEAPIFVSGEAVEGTCWECGAEYSPLVYAVGRTIIPHHFHPVGYSGGIYFYEERLSDISKASPLSISTDHYWLGIVEPIGRIVNWGLHENCIRQSSDKALVSLIIPGCLNGKEVLPKGGLVVESLGSLGLLFPVCESHCKLLDNNSYQLRYQFQTTESGEIHFRDL